MTAQPTKHLETLILAASRLIVLMNHEVELLRVMRVGEIGALQKEKQELTILYEDALQMLSVEPELLEAMEPALRPSRPTPSPGLGTPWRTERASL